MESQKTLNRQNNFEKEKDRGINPLISDYVPKLQASKQYGTSTKTDTQTNGNNRIGSPEIKIMHIWSTNV